MLFNNIYIYSKSFKIILGPNFQDKAPVFRLDKTDAAFVDIYHTNGGT
jgi:hypothetical protein